MPEKPLREFSAIAHGVVQNLTLLRIVSYMTKQGLPAVSLLTTETIEEFKTTDKVVVVAYIAADDKASNQTYTALAESLRDDYIFGATNDAALAKAEGTKQPSIVLYKDFDEGKNVYDAAFEDAAITKFIKSASTPLIGEVGPETYAGYIGVSLASFSLHILVADRFTGRNTSRLYLLRDS